MKALVIGATGATGKDLLTVLLADQAYKDVIIFVRKSTGIVHPKLIEVITNFDHLEKVADAINGDIWFSCLGTTRKAAGSAEKQWAIDHDIPAKFAELAKKNGVNSCVLLSAQGASTNSSIFYSKMKGKLEEHIAALGFAQYIIFQPGLLKRKDTDRWGERIAANILTFLNSLGIAKKFKPLPTSLLAEKMAKAPKTLGPGTHTIVLEKVFSF